jgi:CubicO group peptidase (beta-lactamase class C family)
VASFKLRLIKVIASGAFLLTGATAFSSQSALFKSYTSRENMNLLRGAALGSITGGKSESARFGDGKFPNALFEIGSISKSFTGIVLAQLTIEGKVDLESPVSKFIPELANTFAGTVTARELATHQARLINSYLDSDGRISEKETEEELIQFMKAYQPDPIQFPAAKRQYSNLGFALLGLLIKRVERANSFTEVVEHKILTPLEMKKTRFLVSDTKPFGLLQGYDVLLRPSSYYKISDLACASGGIVSNLEDMMKFLEANAHPSHSKLREAIELSHSLGLGWDSEPGKLPISKNGAMPSGFSSFMVFDPTPGKELGAIVLTNSLNSTVAMGLGTEIVKGADENLPAQALLPVAPDITSKVVGNYLADGTNARIRIFKSGKDTLGAELFSNSGVSGVRLHFFNNQMLFVDTGIQITDAIQIVNQGDKVTEIHYLALTGYDLAGKPNYQKTTFVRDEH